MSEKPSYLAMLSTITAGEGRGYELLSSWAERTSDAELAALLRLVARRSREHAAVFARRLHELGFEPTDSPRSDHQARLELARSDASDVEKFRRLLGYNDDAEESDPLPELFADKSIDVETAMLLGRYIATERDTERRLRAAYARLLRSPEGRERLPLDELYRQLDRLARSIEELKALTRRGKR